MPRPPSGTVHETPRLISQLSVESKPFLNDVQRQALDAALAAKLAKLSGVEPSGICPWCLKCAFRDYVVY